MERALSLIVGQESPSSPLEINASGEILAVTFSADGKHLLSGGAGVRVWQVEDGKQTTTILETGIVLCLAVSKDGRWIAAGTYDGDVYVWDAETHEQVLSHMEGNTVNTVDFSPDSTWLVTGSDNKKATIWDMATRKQVQTLDHESLVFATKYSAQGDRLATGTGDFVRVWDNNDGRLLVTINVGVTPYFNTGLLWSNNHLFAIPYGHIKQCEASTESAISEWPVPDTKLSSCIALPKHKAFIAYSTERTVTCWDTTTRTQCGLVEHTQEIRSISISRTNSSSQLVGWRGILSSESLPTSP